MAQLTSTIIAQGENIAQYKLHKLLGKGSFGAIYLATHPQHGQVALKIERKDNLKPMLEVEYKVLKLMSNQLGFPKVREYREQECGNLLSMEVLDKTLEELLKESNNKFSTKTALNIMLQVLSRLQALHKEGYLYRDIKPGNFMVSKTPPRDLVYILDFGLAKRYVKAPTGCQGTHIPFREQKKMVGTPIFCSNNTHLGYQQSRRDDIESLVYMTIFFLKPLPWEGIKEENKQLKYLKIKQSKLTCSDDQLCKDLPKEILCILKYCKQLGFEQEPDYRYIESLIKDSIKALGLPKYPEFDWQKSGHTNQEPIKVQPVAFKLGLKGGTKPLTSNLIKMNSHSISFNQGNSSTGLVPGNLFDRIMAGSCKDVVKPPLQETESKT